MEYLEIITIIVLYILSTDFIARFIGRKRQIGYGRSIFWCLFLTPILAFPIVLLSKKLNDKKN